MDERFRRFFEDILKHEGGYVNHPNDPGGETKYGISKRSYPNLDIKNLTKEQAMEIYYNDYWIKSNANEIAKVSFQIATKYCDMAINIGINNARKIYLWALENMGYFVDRWDIQKILEITSDIVKKDKKEFLLSFLVVLQKSYYQDLVMKNPKLKVFLSGWLNRAEYRGVAKWG